MYLNYVVSSFGIGLLDIVPINYGIKSYKMLEDIKLLTLTGVTLFLPNINSYVFKTFVIHVRI